MPEAISLKFGMWSAEGGGKLHSKICLVSSRQHEVRKLRFLSSCQYTHGVARRLLGPHDTLPCVLINDDIAEPTEEFVIEIVKITPGAFNVTPGNVTMARGIILDDDGNMHVMFI